MGVWFKGRWGPGTIASRLGQTRPNAMAVSPNTTSFSARFGILSAALSATVLPCATETAMAASLARRRSGPAAESSSSRRSSSYLRQQ